MWNNDAIGMERVSFRPNRGLSTFLSSLASIPVLRGRSVFDRLRVFFSPAPAPIKSRLSAGAGAGAVTLARIQLHLKYLFNNLRNLYGT